jgi:ABC-type transporter Mla subunit MlaD
MGEVSTFVKDNRAILGRNIEGLNRVARVLVKQRGALDQILSSAPLALNNLYMTYNPQSGTLDTRSNQGETEGQIVANPAAFLCGIAAQVDAGEECEQSFPDFFEGARRAPALGGNAVAEPEQFDPTLGGLVEVQR